MESMMSVSDRNERSYQSIMRNSPARKEAAKDIVKKIQMMAERSFSDDDVAKIVDVITWCDIEDGVSIFLASGAPKDKKLVGTVELPTEHMQIYFGVNRSRSSAYPYALGIHFSFKQNHELVKMDLEYLKKEYPTFVRCIQEVVEPGEEYQLKVYPKAAEFYAAVKNTKGEWLVQVPSSKGQFVPNRGIGLKEWNCNVVHIFEPHPHFKTSRKYAKRVCFAF